MVVTAALAAVLLACAAWQLWMSSRPRRTRIIAVLSTAVFGPVLAAGALTTGAISAQSRPGPVNPPVQP